MCLDGADGYAKAGGNIFVAHAVDFAHQVDFAPPWGQGGHGGAVDAEALLGQYFVFQGGVVAEYGVGVVEVVGGPVDFLPHLVEGYVFGHPKQVGFGLLQLATGFGFVGPHKGFLHHVVNVVFYMDDAHYVAFKGGQVLIVGAQQAARRRLGGVAVWWRWRLLFVQGRLFSVAPQG